jgi:deoxycytidylate deaminase
MIVCSHVEVWSPDSIDMPSAAAACRGSLGYVECERCNPGNLVVILKSAEAATDSPDTRRPHISVVEAEDPRGLNVAARLPKGESEQLALLRRIAMLIKGSTITPTREEHWMNLASAMALRSSSFKQRVGCVVVRDDALLAMGVNEVPVEGGGVAWGDEEGIDRDYVISGDPPVAGRKNSLVDRVVGSLLGITPEALEADSIGRKVLSELVAVVDVERALHAEISAVCDAALRGNSLRSSTVYCTHEPCYRCRRQLVAAGVVKAVYDRPIVSSVNPHLWQQLSTNLACVQFSGIRWNSYSG